MIANARRLADIPGVDDMKASGALRALADAVEQALEAGDNRGGVRL